MTSSIDKLVGRIAELNNPSVVGIDPRLAQIPAQIVDAAFARHGKTAAAAAEAFFIFGRGIIDGVCDVVPAVKPQIAFFEQYGAEGIAAYRQTVAYAKGKGLVVIGDVKRGDIASTAAAYSDGHIGRVDIGGERHAVFDEDFITLNPYLGSDAIEPFIADCERYGKGLFVLVKTSNASSRDVQDLTTPNGAVYEEVARLVHRWGEKAIGKRGYSSVGAVVGANFPEQARRIRELLPDAFFLVPGYGAQGALPEGVAACLDRHGRGVVVNNSRGIIFAYADKKYTNDFSEMEFGAAARRACLDMKAELNRITK